LANRASLHKKMNSITRTILALIFCGSLAAQDKPVEEKGPPKTQLEAFAAETGVVIIKGYAAIGTIGGMTGGVSVDCKEFIHAKSETRHYGISIKCTAIGARIDSVRESISFIDYDEIDSLIAGIDYIGKITASVTKLGGFEARYSTKGNFEITVFNNPKNGKLSVAVETGRISPVTVSFGIEKLPEFRTLVVRAKAKLDEIKK
jgi:hypothetical protein